MYPHYSFIIFQQPAWMDGMQLPSLEGIKKWLDESLEEDPSLLLEGKLFKIRVH